MSAPVDVQGDIRNLLAYVNGYEWGRPWAGRPHAEMDAAEKALDAVAELIEAAAELRAAHRELPWRDHPTEVRQACEERIGRAHYALDVALSRVGGAP
jgi:hypothetical protein